MNATLINGGRVHWLPAKSARCGVGKNRERGQWQMDLGEVTCLRCRALAEKKAAGVGAPACFQELKPEGQLRPRQPEITVDHAVNNRNGVKPEKE